MVLRIIRLQDKIVLIQDDIHRQLCRLGLVVLAILLLGMIFIHIFIPIFFISLILLYFLFIDTSILQFLETDSDGSTYSFHLWFYYILMSISSAGSSRISPHTIPGKLISIITICFLLIYIPDQASVIWEKMSRISKYARSKYTPSRNIQHVVICGDISSVNMKEFMEELFHEDHTKDLVINAIILNPGTILFIYIMLYYLILYLC